MTAHDEAREHLGNLLAIIHGDGGHYQAEHGNEKATTDAIAKYYELRARHDEALPGVELSFPSPRTSRDCIIEEGYHAAQEVAALLFTKQSHPRIPLAATRQNAEVLIAQAIDAATRPLVDALEQAVNALDRALPQIRGALVMQDADNAICQGRAALQPYSGQKDGKS